ncbi:hypothetical protein [Flavobacterium psychrophilum]|uniref:hypothetical protein n=1 Tax=Flavobacterium psychrophilum TaxID=96345 RepID=UPI00313A3241
MSKNAEIIAEIISEEVNKFEKLVTKQSEFIQEFSNTIERAERIAIKTDRLEEIIEHWNSLFDKQKQQIKALQSKQLIENRIHRVTTYLLLATIIITVLINKIK